MPDVGLTRLNSLPLPKALKALGACCACTNWCLRMASGRPYPNRNELLRFSDLKFRSLTRNEWAEAFAHCPPLTDDPEVAALFDEAGRSELDDLRRKYRTRFGHEFVLFANGLDADQILAHLRRRINYDRFDEMSVAGDNQRKITQERLIVLLDALESVETGSDDGMEDERVTGTVYLKARGDQKAREEESRKSA